MGVLEAALKSKDKMLDGETVFKLYDTYGFPLDLTADIARERGVAVDLTGYEAAMRAQQERSREGSNFATVGGVTYAGAKTEFVGYEKLEETGSVVALYKAGTAVERIGAGDSAIVVLDRTPFYAESGGQVGDQGSLETTACNFVVQDTQKVQADVFGHHAKENRRN
jgi:alanyl-tRNA synthetase